jgi:hypothetical protein
VAHARNLGQALTLPTPMQRQISLMSQTASGKS